MGDYYWHMSQINGQEDDFDDTPDLFDAFEPDWIAMPDEAQWHTVDEDGAGHWWIDIPTAIIEPESDCGIWWSDKETAQKSATVVNMFGCDWRNSLRHRPFLD